MLSAKARNVLASAIALIVLVCMVSTAAAILFDGQDFFGALLAGNLIAIPAALANWSGAVWKDAPVPSDWREWINVFFGAAILSGVFIAIDMTVEHPGFSLVLTIAALAQAFVALPSALRAWILERPHRVHDKLDR